jgi:hypothetical protein
MHHAAIDLRVLVVIFQSTFRLEMHQNVFFKKKIIFDISTSK